MPSTGSLFLPGFDPRAGTGGGGGGWKEWREGLHHSGANAWKVSIYSYCCSGVKDRAEGKSAHSLTVPLPLSLSLSSLLPSLHTLEMEGLGTYFCSGVKDRSEEERPLVTIKLAIDK